MNDAKAETRPSMSVCEYFQESAIAACEEWDGVSNADLMELIRNEFGQTIHQFYGLDQNGDTWRELAKCRETIDSWREEVRRAVKLLDELAALCGDGGSFRQCRDRLRTLVG